MADAGIGRRNLEILKTVLSPAKQRVALYVAHEFEFGIESERLRRAELIDLDRMVDHEFGGEQGIDFPGIAAEFAHGLAHRGEINNGGPAGVVLQQYARGQERYFL